MKSTVWHRSLVTLVAVLAPLAAHATFNLQNPTFNFYGDDSLVSSDLIETVSTTPNFVNGSLGVQLSATSGGNAAQVTEYLLGVGVIRPNSLFDSGAIDASAGDVLTLSFNKVVNLSQIQFSFWDNNSFLNLTDHAVISNGTQSVSLDNNGSVNPLDPYLTNFSLSGMVGQTFTITAKGDLTSTFRLAGLTAQAVQSVPEPQTWALFGLGLIGLVARARRRQA
jgi:hypothetical protein